MTTPTDPHDAPLENAKAPPCPQNASPAHSALKRLAAEMHRVAGRWTEAGAHMTAKSVGGFADQLDAALSEGFPPILKGGDEPCAQETNVHVEREDRPTQANAAQSTEKKCASNAAPDGPSPSGGGQSPDRSFRMLEASDRVKPGDEYFATDTWEPAPPEMFGWHPDTEVRVRRPLAGTPPAHSALREGVERLALDLRRQNQEVGDIYGGSHPWFNGHIMAHKYVIDRIQALLAAPDDGGLGSANCEFGESTLTPLGEALMDKALLDWLEDHRDEIDEIQTGGGQYWKIAKQNLKVSMGVETMGIADTLRQAVRNAIAQEGR